MQIDRSRARRHALAAALLAALTLSTSGVEADPVGVINALRTDGCSGASAIGTPVRPDAELDAAARELSRGRDLEEAVARAGYRAASSRSFHVRGPTDDAAVRRILAERSCAAINDPRYDDIGVHRRGDETWIVLAVRQELPPPLDRGAVERRVLELVNAARAEARACGRERYAATVPVTLSVQLANAAAIHARDMAQRGAIGHRGSDGSESGERITRTGYVWRASGENVAAGQRDADAVVAAWLASPGHCATLMGPHFTEMGVAYALAPAENPAIYWAQVFAAPR